MVLRALVAALFLIFACVPSGACCVSRAAEAAASDHAHRHDGAPDQPDAAGHPAKPFVCASFCAAAPVALSVTTPGEARPVEVSGDAASGHESVDGEPSPPPPRSA